VKRFQNDIFDEKESNVAFIGIPFGKIGIKMLEELRKVSWFIEPFDIYWNKNLLENVRIYDYGNFSIENVKNILKNVLEKNKVPIIFSNSHLTTYYILKYLEKKVSLIIFDAHLDLKNKYKDEKIKNDEYLNDSTWLRRAIEENFIKDVFIFGARSCDEDEIEFAKKNKVKIVNNFNEKIKIKGELYISFDFDVFDSSLINSEYPEPEGINLVEIRKFLKNNELKPIIMDFCLMNFSKELEEKEYFLICKTIFLFISKL